MSNLNTIARGPHQSAIEMMRNPGAGRAGSAPGVVDIPTTPHYGIMPAEPYRANNPDRDRVLLGKDPCARALYRVPGARDHFDKEKTTEGFSQVGTRFVGHPNMDALGIESNSGSWGHGMSTEVCMALAAKTNGPGHSHVVAGDGGMAVESDREAMMAVGFGSENLCLTIDLNRLQIAGAAGDVMSTGDVGEKSDSCTMGRNEITCAAIDSIVLKINAMSQASGLELSEPCGGRLHDQPAPDAMPDRSVPYESGRFACQGAFRTWRRESCRYKCGNSQEGAVVQTCRPHARLQVGWTSAGCASARASGPYPSRGGSNQ